MTRRVREHPEAAAELDSAIDWYARRGRVTALEFVGEVEASIRRIADWPTSGQPYAGRESAPTVLRTTRVKRFPYRVVYLIDGTDIVIFAYAHDRRRPGYWRHRVEA